MARFLRSYGQIKNNNFLQKGLLYYGWGAVAAFKRVFAYIFG